MYRLSQLIFIDSYSPGKRTIVNLKGNTNLNGDNGFGKMTMLRVLPLFFGAAPGQLVRRSGTNKSFVDYYLPRNSSYIIFEYERDSEKNLVVIFRSDNSLRFRFLKSAYDDVLFFDDDSEQSNVIIASDWAKVMKLRGYDPSQILGIEDYKNIIQSGLSYTAVSERKRKAIINKYRSLYSFCQRGTSIENIDLITTAILEREPSVGAIKEILTSILVHTSHADTDKIPKLSVKPSKLAEWINDKDAYQAMDSCEHDIQELTRLKYEYDECLKSQKKFRTQAKMMLSRSSKELDVADIEKKEHAENLSKHQNDISTKKRKYLDKKNELESEINSFDRKISSLEKEQEDYKKQNIKEKQDLVEKIPEITKKIKQLDQQYNELIGEQQDIENKFEKLKNASKEDHQSVLLAYSEEENTQLENHQQKTALLNNELNKLLEAEEKKYLNEYESLQNRLNELKIDKARLEASLINISPPPDLKNTYQTIEKNLHDLNTKTASLDENVNQSIINQQEHTNAIKSLSEEAETFQREKRELDKQLNQLKQLKSPNKNNLLTFLRGNHETWSENIAKVVPEDLLLRTDLSPEIINTEQTLYGVRLDLSVIETTRAADETQLQQQMLQVNDQLADKEEDLKALRESSKQLNQQSKSFETSVLEAQTIRRKHEELIEDNRRQLDLYKLQIETAITELKKETEKQIEEFGERIEAENARINANNEDYETNKKSIHSLFKTRKDELEQNLQAKKDKITLKIQDSKISHEHNLKQLDDQKAKALVDNGVNPEFLNSLTSQLQEQEEQRKLAKESLNLVEKYIRWLENDWNQKESLQRDHQLSNEALAESTKQWKLQKQDLTFKENELKKTLDGLEKKCQQLEADTILLSRMMEGLPDKGMIPIDDEYIGDFSSISLLESRWRKSIAQDQELTKTGGSIYNQIRSKINAYRDSPPQKFLERLSADLSQNMDSFKLEWAYATDGLGDYMRKDHQEHLSILQDSARLLGQQISDYYANLSRTHNNINQLGRKVSKHSQSVIDNFPAIDNLNVSVQSSLDKLEFWGSFREVLSEPSILGCSNAP